MKKIIFVAILALTFGFAYAQKKVPDAVTAKFKSAYPNITKVKWGAEGANWEAEFKMNNVEMSTLYDASGNLLETDTGMAVTALPATVTSYMTANVPGKKITEASKIVDGSGKVTYEAEAGGMDYIFDEQGNFIKTAKD